MALHHLNANKLPERKNEEAVDLRYLFYHLPYFHHLVFVEFVKEIQPFIYQFEQERHVKPGRLFWQTACFIAGL